jgi:hypothetical protein
MTLKINCSTCSHSIPSSTLSFTHPFIQLRFKECHCELRTHQSTEQETVSAPMELRGKGRTEKNVIVWGKNTGG